MKCSKIEFIARIMAAIAILTISATCLRGEPTDRLADRAGLEMKRMRAFLTAVRDWYRGYTDADVRSVTVPLANGKRVPRILRCETELTISEKRALAAEYQRRFGK